jgi:hypothetical protein
VRFIDRADLNRDDFDSATGYQPGDLLELRAGLTDPTQAWAISAVVPGREGLPDTLVCDAAWRQEVTVSDAAAAFAKERGGRIYVWAEPLGSTASWLRTSTDDPGGDREYERRDVCDVEVFIAKDVTPPEIKVRLSVSRQSLAEWPGGSVPGGSP